MFLQQINIFPIKSCAGIRLNDSNVEDRGLPLDRRWMLIEEDGSFISQRSTPQLGQIQVLQGDEYLIVSYPGQVSFEIPWKQIDGPSIRTQVWKDEVEGRHVSLEADDWFSNVLGRRVHLAHMDESVKRPLITEMLPKDRQFEVSFADGYPFLLTNQASLNDLNARLDQPITMDRFRSNLVVEGFPAFAEDHWKRVQIGVAEFLVAKACGRCQVTTIDPLTGRSSKEPLKTLSTYRKQDGQVLFGMNLVALNKAPISEGDKVIILE